MKCLLAGASLYRGKEAVKTRSLARGNGAGSSGAIAARGGLLGGLLLRLLLGRRRLLERAERAELSVAHAPSPVPGPRIVSPALEGWMIVVFEENFPQNAAMKAEATAAHSSPDIMESARASWSVAEQAPIP